MPEPLKFVILTESQYGPGTVVNAILRGTAARITRIYYDLRERPAGRPRPASASPPLTLSDKLRLHARLALKMPRHYAYLVLERLFGCSQLQILSIFERLHPALVRAACGLRLPPNPRGGRILCKLDDVARAHGIPIVKVPNLNGGNVVAALKDDRPDVLLGLGTRILSAQLLETARIGTLNAHSSLLPDYRGGSTEFWQLVHGATQTGVTIHWMAPRVDEGPICGQRSWPIPSGADHHKLRILSLFNRLDLWCEIIQKIVEGAIPNIPQGPSRTPTFRHPSLLQQSNYYVAGRRGAEVEALAEPSPARRESGRVSDT
jgi:folate-dependent phosphoribosylglycinamide formyltransferase PurN